MSKKKAKIKKRKQPDIQPANKPREKLSNQKRFLMILFPPYGVYHLLFESKVRWFIKYPVGILILLMVILSVDQAAHPHRVEEKLVKESITAYLEEHPEERMGILREADRQGAFIWEDDTHLVYRTLTTNSLYDFVMIDDKDGRFKVNGVFQTYPTSLWKNDESKKEYPTAPMAMMYFFENREELGDLKSATEDDAVNTFETTKGTFRYTFEKNKVVSVEKENGEILLQQKSEYTMPEHAIEYFEKHQDTLGKLMEVYGYEVDTVKEMYYVKTNTGIYRVDDYRDGNIKLLKQTETDDEKPSEISTEESLDK